MIPFTVFNWTKICVRLDQEAYGLYDEVYNELKQWTNSTDTGFVHA